MTSMSSPITWIGAAILFVALSLYGIGGIYAPYVMLLVAVLALVALAFTRTYQPNAATYAFAAAFALIVVSYLFANNQPNDILVNANWIWLLLFIPLGAILQRIASPRSAVIVARLAVVGVALTLALAVGQYIATGGERVGQVTTDPIRIANTAVILGFVGLMGFVADTGWRRYLYVLGVVMATAVVILAETRGAIIGLGVVSVVAVLFLVRRKGIALLVGAILAAVVVAAVLVAAYYKIARTHVLVQAIGELLSGRDISNKSSSVRWIMLQSAWGAFLDSPIYGHGWQRLMTAILPHLPEGQEAATKGQPHLHNDIADFAVSSGLMGLITYPLILLSPLIAAWTSVRDSLYRVRLFGVVMLVACYAVLGLNALMFGFEVHTSLFVALAAILLSYCRDAPPERAITPASS